MKKILSLFLTLIMLFSLGITAFAAEEAVETSETVNYTENNSYQVVVSVPQKMDFTPESFPEVVCSEVLTATMGKTETGYKYTLVVVYEEDIDVAAEMEKIAKNSMVMEVAENSYITKSSRMKLSEESILLKVGESKDITIDELELYSTDEDYYLVLTLDSEVYDKETVEPDIFSEYGMDELLSFEEAEELGYSADEYRDLENGFVGVTDSTKENCVNVANGLIEADVVQFVTIYEFRVRIGGAPPSETWEVVDSTVAGVTLSGGVQDELLSNVFKDQTATVTGLKAGETTLSVYRCDNCMSAIAECAIRVYLPGDTNLDNTADANDALDILKVTAGITELNELGTIAADVDEDTVITAEDALAVLKGIVGL